MATATKTKLQNFIDGESVDAADGATEEVTNPANGEVIAEMPLSTEEDVNRAVAAAKRAFDGWADDHAGRARRARCSSSPTCSTSTPRRSRTSRPPTPASRATRSSRTRCRP